MSPDKSELLQIVTHRVNHAIQLATETRGRQYRYTDIRLDLRGRAAGQLVYQRRFGKLLKPEFRFNYKMLSEHSERFLAEVVPHEVAHLVAYSDYGTGIRPHGLEWKQIMREVYGLEPNVTHDFPVEKRQKQQYPYVCACIDQVHRLGVIRHRRISKGERQYICRSCGEILKPCG